jgi:hypothetical protein
LDYTHFPTAIIAMDLSSIDRSLIAKWQQTLVEDWRRRNCLSAQFARRQFGCGQQVTDLIQIEGGGSWRLFSVPSAPKTRMGDAHDQKYRDRKLTCRSR